MADVLTIVFDIESEAYQAFLELKSFKQGSDTQVAQITLVKDKDGKVTIKDSIDFDDASRDYATVGGIIGDLLGILSGPIGTIIGYDIGSLASAADGSVTGASDNSLTKEVTTKLLDSDVATIALVHRENEGILNHAFAPYEANIVRWDAFALAREVEFTGQVRDGLYDKVQEDLNERRPNCLKGQGSDIADAVKAAFRHLRGKE